MLVLFLDHLIKKLVTKKESVLQIDLGLKNQNNLNIKDL